MGTVTHLAKPTRTLRRYVLYQIPGCLLAIATAVVLHYRVNLPVWWGIALVASWVIKDAVLYPFLRNSYDSDSPDAIDQLIGLDGVAIEPLAPQGYIRVRGELWLAEPYSAGITIGRNRPVTVDSVQGTVLLVRPAPAEMKRSTSPPAPRRTILT